MRNTETNPENVTNLAFKENFYFSLIESQIGL